MKTHTLIASVAILFSITGAGMAGCSGANAETPAPQLLWEAENIVAADGRPAYRQTFTVTGDLRGVRRLAFNQFARRMSMADSTDTIIEIVPGYYAVGSPRFGAATGADTLSFSIVTAGTLRSICYSPDGAHLVMNDGSTRALNLVRGDITKERSGYAPVNGDDYMPYGEEIYAFNEQISGDSAGALDAIPSFKTVILTGGVTVADPDKAIFVTGGDEEKELYSINISDGTVTVTAPQSMWPRLRRRIGANFGHGARTFPECTVTDYPSLPYRGLMIDIARNFQSADELHRIIGLMADYGLNTLHFHAVDDEGWRLEIPALPELTAVGSRRGYTPSDSAGAYLPQIFHGDGNPGTPGHSNGYISVEQMISLLRHADTLGIAVIPEIESPGHARAAIEAMKYRAATTGDDSYILAESAGADTSRYTSAQSFHDNVMNPALPGPYKFMSTVADGIADIYRLAGVPLKAIHIGGDEVPRNAWSGSAAAQKLAREKGLKGEKELHAYFVRRVVDDYAAKGIPVSGWQEIAFRHDKEYDTAVLPAIYSVNCWSTLPSQGQGGVITDIATAGYPLVLSNVDHFYMDMCYSYHPYERGLTWGGTVNEFDALHGYPCILCPVEGARLKGVQGQVFAETIRSGADLERMILPKMLGLAERAWNPDSTYADSRFNAVIANHMEGWLENGYTFHVHQPGIHLTDEGNVVFNSPYPNADIYYTFITPGQAQTSDSEPAGWQKVTPGTAVALPCRPVQVRAYTQFGKTGRDPLRSVQTILKVQ